jgi:hypothetical protein
VDIKLPGAITKLALNFGVVTWALATGPVIVKIPAAVVVVFGFAVPRIRAGMRRG